MAFKPNNDNETYYFKHLVNAHQTSEERCAKYHLCICLGDSGPNARRRRDWRLNKIARVHGYSDFKSMKESMSRYGKVS